MAEARITIDPRYFREIVRSKYREPLGFIFARETFQNAYDAGASSVRYRSGVDEHGFWIEVEDDGRGMSTVRKMLGIGAATKEESDGRPNAGGFGTAKEIVLFAWPRWVLESRAERVTSEDVKEERQIQQTSHLSGTRIRVWHGGEIRLSDVEFYLRLTNGVRADIDGRVIPSFRRGSLRSDEGWAEVYTSAGDKAPARGRIVVRWEGVAMFTEWIDRDDIMTTIQLQGECTELLHEARESLRSPHSSFLWRLRRELEKNPLSRGQEAREDEIHLYVGDGVVSVPESAYESTAATEALERARAQAKVQSHVKPEEAPTPAELAEALTQAYRAGVDLGELLPVSAAQEMASSDEGGTSLAAVAALLPPDMEAPFRQWAEAQRSPATAAPAAPPAGVPERVAEVAQREEEPGAPASHPRHGPRIHGLGAPQRFEPRQPNRSTLYPRDYAVKCVGGRTCRLDLSQDRYARLLFGWEAAVEAAVASLAKVHHESSGSPLGSKERSFRIGFVVEGTQRAEMLRAAGERYFLLNPREVQASQSLGDIAHALLSLATHEVAHIFHGHGEEFDALWMRLLLETSLTGLMKDDRMRCVHSSNADLVYAVSARARRRLREAA